MKFVATAPDQDLGRPVRSSFDLVSQARELVAARRQADGLRMAAKSFEAAFPSLQEGVQIDALDTPTRAGRQARFSPARQGGAEKTENRAARLSSRPALSVPSRSRLGE